MFSSTLPNGIVLTAPTAEALAAAVTAVMAVAAPSAPAVEVPTDAPALRAGQWAEISTHVRERRLARAEATPRGGLTSKQRQELAAEMRAAGKDPHGAAWTRAVKAYKAAGRHI